ncbi:MAG: PilN domain-containing protein [Candidatus Shapirobacteria bacterium]
MSGKKEISLLPNELDNNSIAARAIRYLTTIGRYIIVFTELIVISAFISRFWLDRQNSDLSEVLRQQKAILESTADFEKEYVSLQSRLKYIDTQYKNQPNYIQNIQSLVSSIPLDVFFQNFTISRNKAQVSMYSYQEDSLVNLIVNLSLNPNIKTVNIQKIEKKSKDSKFFVDISLEFKDQSAKPTI